MTDTFEFTLNNPLTEEQWDMITDVDFDRTDHVTFHTKHGKEVEFAKVIRCKDCIYFTPEKSGEHWNVCRFYDAPKTADGYCNDAERKEE